LNGIDPQITLPSPLHLASKSGEWKRRLHLAHFSPPRGKSAVATCEEVGGGGGEALNGGLAWLLETTNIVFDDFFEVIGHLVVLLADSFSSLNSGSFDTN
jgi:hypothetical protein